MITSADTAEVHPPAFVTVKLYDPGLRPDTVKVVPDALAVMLPGKRVRVHVPSAGSPDITMLPVGISQVGWVMVPGTGGVGVTGCGLIITSCEGSEVHSLKPLTVNVYVPGCIPVIVVLTPVPVYVAPSGWRVKVHEPGAGRPEMNTLPVDILHDGWVTFPIAGVSGSSGPWLISTTEEGPEVHPASFVTVKVYVPAGIPVISVLLPDPVVTTSPGVRVTIHEPVEGSPESSTVPVGELHEGWVTAPGTGGEGTTGGSFITTFSEGAEVHPDALATVKYHVPDSMLSTVRVVPLPLKLRVPG
jgi:hypothetical protein